MFPFWVIAVVLAVGTGTAIETHWCSDETVVRGPHGDKLCLFVEKDRQQFRRQ